MIAWLYILGQRIDIAAPTFYARKFVIQIRGLLQHTIPHTYIQLYVHRSGRTARAQREGLSVMFVGPEDLKSYRNICKSLNKGNAHAWLVVYTKYTGTSAHNTHTSQ